MFYRLAILGFHLEHSLSPYIHNLAFQKLGLEGEYVKYEIEPGRWESEVHALKSGGWQGFNVTIPFKEKIIPHIDQLDELAIRIGAVNTVVQKEGRWHGFNTDWQGFLRPIRNHINTFERVLILGAGGAARAVAFALLQETQACLTLMNRTLDRARKLADSLNRLYPGRTEIKTFDQLEKGGSDPFDLIVNTTSVGMGKNRGRLIIDPLPLSTPNTLLYDLIYNPSKTPFLEKGEQAGLQTVNGLPMLIFQAEEAFYLWTGRKFGKELIDELLERLPALIS